MDGQNQSVGRSDDSDEEEGEEDDQEDGGEESADTASIKEVEPEWKSTTEPVKPSTIDRYKNRLLLGLKLSFGLYCVIFKKVVG